MKNFVDTPATAPGQIAKGATLAAAKFSHALSLDEVPQAIVVKARTCLLYGLGIGLACIHGRFGRTAVQALVALEGSSDTGGATALATGHRLSVSAAAFCNAVMFHGRCQEDTLNSSHLGVAIWPTLLALVESGRAPASNLLVAAIAAYQTAGAIERQIGRHSSAQGFRASPLYGTLAAATAAAKAMELTLAQTQAALAHAAAFAGGTLQGVAEGADEWRHQMGAAARRGMEAAFLARAGSVGSLLALEGPRGFAFGFARNTLETPEFGQWLLPEIAFKPFPICNRNQAAAALAIRIRSRFDVEQIQMVRMRIHPNVLNGMINPGPFELLGQTLLSVNFCCATALARGAIELRALSEFNSPDIASLLARIQVSVDPAVPYLSAAATVETVDGVHHELVERRGLEDFDFTRGQVNDLLAGLAGEMQLPVESMRALDSFAYANVIDSAQPVLAAFANAREFGQTL